MIFKHEREFVFRPLLSYASRSRKKGAPTVIVGVPLQWDGARSGRALQKPSRFLYLSSKDPPLNSIHADETKPPIKIHLIGERFKKSTVCISSSLRSMRSWWRIFFERARTILVRALIRTKSRTRGCGHGTIIHSGSEKSAFHSASMP